MSSPYRGNESVEANARRRERFSELERVAATIYAAYIARLGPTDDDVRRRGARAAFVEAKAFLDVRDELLATTFPTEPR